MAERPDKQLTVRVLPWEGVGWGVDIDHGNGKHDAYPVGGQEAAEAEAQRVRLGGAARTSEEVERSLKEAGLI
jgi:hypothetical protein